MSNAAPDLVLLGNLLVDDIVLADGRTLLGEPGGAVLHTALAASLWGCRPGVVSVLGSDYPQAAIGAGGVRIFADIKKKHSSHAITADVDIPGAAKTAEFCLADGLVVTGESTGRQAAPDEVRDAAAAVSIPVLVGSGVTIDNIDRYPTATGFIVGSAVKRGGDWREPLDADQAKALADAFAGLAPPEGTPS